MASQTSDAIEVSFSSPKDFLDSCFTFMPEEAAWPLSVLPLPPTDVKESLSEKELPTITVPSTSMQKKPASAFPSPLAINTHNLSFRNPPSAFLAASPLATSHSPISSESCETLSPVNPSSAAPLSAGVFDSLRIGYLPSGKAMKKTYICHCGKSYDKKYCLDSHLKSHSLKKPYICKCSKAFGRNHDLLRHIRTVHGSKNYSEYRDF
ncbi:MAG: hypothetical protein SGCHY_003147 [Lobulomycetales sp.]